MSRARRASIAVPDPRPRLAAYALAGLISWAILLCSLSVVAGPARADEATRDLDAPRLLALNGGPPAPVPPPALGPTDPAREPGEARRPDAAADDSDAVADDGDWLDDDFDLESEFDAMSDDDPLEGMNRGIFAFNRQVDRFMLTPVTGVYQTLVPTPARSGVYNVFMNLDAPVRLTNSMLQGRPKAGGIALARFIVNTTFGIGGLFDVGSRVGLEQQRADFGQTLATWGAPQGPYLIFPFLGPMTVRNGLGMGVDFLMQPVSYVVGPLPGMIVGAGKDFSRRERAVIELESLRDASLDFYAALRSAFLQDRADLVAARDADVMIEEMPSAGSDSELESLSPAEREARCLAHPRSRRELAKPGMRAMTRARCAARAEP